MNSDPNAASRVVAAEALGKIGDARAVEPLIAALKYGVGAYSAAEALGRMHDPRAVEPLADALAEGDEALRRSAAEALAEFGDARAVGPLISELRGNTRSIVAPRRRLSERWASAQSGRSSP